MTQTANQAATAKTATRQDEVTMTWTGQDGNQWRELKCWVGNGYRSFTQRHIGGGVWI